MKRIMVLLAAVPTLLVACGDDDDDAGGATTVASDTTTATGGGDTATSGDSDYCTALAEFKASNDEFAPVMASGTATPAEMETAITAQRSKLDALVDAVPEEIESDLDAVAGPTYAFMDALADAGYDLGAMTNDAATAEVVAHLDSPEYTEAAARVDAYGQESCGITIGD